MSDLQSNSAAARSSRNEVQQKYVLFLLILCTLSAWRLRSIDLSSLHPVEVNIDEAVLAMLKQANNLSSTLEAAVHVVSDAMPPSVDKRTPKGVVAYATSVTHCKAGSSLVDGAAVLKHSIHLSSIRNPNSTSKYDYEMIAFVHSNATACAPVLEKLGYSVQIRETPVDISKINNTAFVERLRNPKSGCCGEKEFLKLYAYALMDYPIAVHLDLDVLVLRPLDQLFDAMLLPENTTKRLPDAMWNKTVEHPINAFFTRDYPLSPTIKPADKVGMQGGFLVVRPDMDVYEKYRQIIHNGEFVPGEGWGGKKLHYGGFYGAAQIQGVVPYFYGEYQPNTYVELNRCYYNQMVDNPYVEKNGKTRCATGEEKCQDCRETDVADIYLAHFTFCQKPWKCSNTKTDAFVRHYWQGRQAELCMALHHEWHRVRYDLEESWGTAKPIERSASFGTSDIISYYYGHCKGGRTYIPLELS